jgi:hypothetical protein
LRDLAVKIDAVLNSKGYGQDVHANMGAALRSRVNSLLVGLKGEILDTRRSVPFDILFANPTVVELQQLGDDEEKAFVIALMFSLLSEYAQVRQRDLPDSRRGRLQHLTLIEEAHRLLSPSRAGAMETADSRGKAVATFANLLAELRSFGEGFIIAEQIPTKLTPETMKNTALKIIHRLSSIDDRTAMGGCASLNTEQVAHLNVLRTGEAVVHDGAPTGPVLVKMDAVSAKDQMCPKLPKPDSARLDYLRRGGGCELCRTPCTHWHAVHNTELADNASRIVRQLLDQLLYEPDEPTPVGLGTPVWARETDCGRRYCALLGAARELLARHFTAINAAHRERPFAGDGGRRSEEALRALGPVLDGLAKGQSIGSLDALGVEIRRLLVGSPLAPDGACRQCSKSCLALALTAQAFAPLKPKLTPLLFGGQTPDTRASSFSRTAESEFQKLLSSNILKYDKWRRPWLHCMTVQLSQDNPADANVLTLQAYMNSN